MHLPRPAPCWHSTLTLLPGPRGRANSQLMLASGWDSGQTGCRGPAMCPESLLCHRSLSQPGRARGHFLWPWQDRAPGSSSPASQLTMVATSSPQGLETEISNLNANSLRSPVYTVSTRPGQSDTGPEEIRGFWNKPPTSPPPAYSQPVSPMKTQGSPSHSPAL